MGTKVFVVVVVISSLLHIHICNWQMLFSVVFDKNYSFSYLLRQIVVFLLILKRHSGYLCEREMKVLIIHMLKFLQNRQKIFLLVWWNLCSNQLENEDNSARDARRTLSWKNHKLSTMKKVEKLPTWMYEAVNLNLITSQGYTLMKHVTLTHERGMIYSLQWLSRRTHFN